MDELQKMNTVIGFPTSREDLRYDNVNVVCVWWVRGWFLSLVLALLDQAEGCSAVGPRPEIIA